MTRSLKRHVAAALLALATWAGVSLRVEAALRFAAVTSDNVDFGAAAPFLKSGGSITIMTWFTISNLSPGNFTRLWGIGNVTVLQHTNASTDVVCFIDRVTTDSQSATNNFSMATNTWYFLGITYTEAAGCKVYKGTLTTTPVELTYSTQTVGTGATVDHSATAVIVGNRGSKAAAWGGDIASVAIVDGILATGQMASWQFARLPTASMNLYSELGFNGTGSQADWSGSGHAGTVTGSAVVAHVPIGRLFF
jgi:hypothetical protein